METARSKYLGQLRTESEHVKSGTKIITDAPPDNHGKGEAFSPTDLLATSLGVCMITIIGINAEKNGWSIDGAEWKVTKIMADNPRRVSEIIVELTFKGEYTDQQKRLIEYTTKNCPVALSLHPDLKQTIVISYQ
ncbi:MAG: OsmC family protein [Syntrophothermus sp.]